MPEIKIRCVHCNKRFSGERGKIDLLTKCPKCGSVGDWWTVLVPSTSPGETENRVLKQGSPNGVNSAELGSPSSTSTLAQHVNRQPPSLPSRMPKLLVLLLLATMLSVAGISAGVWWLVTSGGKTGQSAKSVEEAPLAEAKALKSRLAVGVSYKEYVVLLGDLNVKLDVAEEASDGDPSLALTYLKRAFLHFDYARLVWQESFKSNGKFVPYLFRDTLVTEYGLAGTSQIWLDDALNAIWGKAGDFISKADAELKGTR